VDRIHQAQCGGSNSHNIYINKEIEFEWIGSIQLKVGEPVTGSVGQINESTSFRREIGEEFLD
jgi:hypothetical protein